MENVDLIVIGALDLFGTCVFAITGALRGYKARLDLLGTLVLASVVGIGGGLIRDAMIGATPAAAMQDARYLVVCVCTGLLVFFIAPHLNKQWRIISFCDAIGLGVFTSIGVEKGLSFGLPSITIVFCGVLTAVGGGAIRDIMVMRIPAVLKSDFYATASLLGGILFLCLVELECGFFMRFICVSLFVLVLRLAAMHYRLYLPGAGQVDLLIYGKKHVRKKRRLKDED